MRFTRTRQATAAGAVFGMALAVGAPYLPSFALLETGVVGDCSVPVVDERLNHLSPAVSQYSPATSWLSPPLGDMSCPVQLASPPYLSAESSPHGDMDGDGFADDADNCPDTRNRTQGDADNDGVGNVCDPDPGLSNWALGGGETVSTSGGSNWFEFAVHADRYTFATYGWVEYVDEQTGQHFVSDNVGGFIYSNGHAEFSGTGTVNGSPVNYTLAVTDNGEPGSLDSFSLRWFPLAPSLVPVDARLYVAGPTLTQGNIQVLPLVGY